MELQLDMKLPEEMSEQELEEKRLERLTSNDYDPNEEDEVKYTYRPMVFTIEDVKGFVAYDNEHTELRFIYGFMYARIQFEHFKAIYETAKGIKVKTLEDFKIIKR